MIIGSDYSTPAQLMALADAFDPGSGTVNELPAIDPATSTTLDNHTT